MCSIAIYVAILNLPLINSIINNYTSILNIVLNIVVYSKGADGKKIIRSLPKVHLFSIGCCLAYFPFVCCRPTPPEYVVHGVCIQSVFPCCQPAILSLFVSIV